MFNSPKSSFKRSSFLAIKCLDVFVILSMILQSFAVAVTPATAEVIDTVNEKATEQVVKFPEKEMVEKPYQSPEYEHPEAVIGEHTLAQEEIVEVEEQKDQQASPSPILFIENVGQFDEKAAFIAQVDQGQTFFSKDAIWLSIIEEDKENNLKTQNTTTIFGHDETDPLGINNDEKKKYIETNIKMSFPDSNPDALIEGTNPVDTKVSFFLGNDQSKWESDVPVYSGIRYKQFYPGYDLEISGESGKWEWKFIESLSTTPGKKNNKPTTMTPRLRIEGADSQKLDADGINLSTKYGDFSIPVPGIPTTGKSAQTPQNQNNKKRIPYMDGKDLILPFDNDEASEFFPNNTFLAKSNKFEEFTPSSPISFYSGKPGYAKQKEYKDDLIIKKSNMPVNDTVNFLFSTFFDSKSIVDMTIDGEYLYITGTVSSNYYFPQEYGTRERIMGGIYEDIIEYANDIFVAKIDSSSQIPEFVTIIGGMGADVSGAIGLDQEGNIYVAGYSWYGYTGEEGASGFNSFPITSSAFLQSSENGVVFLKLNPSGNSLLYSTFYGYHSIGFGNYYNPTDIAVVSENNIYVTGWASQYNGVPLKNNPIDDEASGGSEVFIAEFNPSVSGEDSLIFSSYYGGSANDYSTDMLYNNGKLFITGSTTSDDIPLENETDAILDGTSDAFLLTLDTSNNLIYSSYIGGSGDESGGIIELGANDELWLFENSSSTDITEGNSLNISNTPSFERQHAFIATINTSDFSIEYRLKLITPETIVPQGLFIDHHGRMILNGSLQTHNSTFSTYFETYHFQPTNNAYDNSNSIDPQTLNEEFLDTYSEGFILALNPNLTQVEYASYLGGFHSDAFTSSTHNDEDIVYITGWTSSGDTFPISENAFDSIPINNYAANGFLAAFKLSAGPAIPINSILNECPGGKECLYSNYNGTTESDGKPINTSTGGLYYQHMDFSIPTSADSLTFERTYSSLSTGLYNSILGSGWTHNLDTRLVLPESEGGEEGLVWIKAHSANQYKFEINTDGTFSASPGVSGVLIQESAAPVTYSLSLPNHTIYTFDTDGKLTTLQDDTGHTWVYTYDTSGLLTQVSDDTGTHTLSLGYDTSGRITSVTDNANRLVTYSYDTFGDLISATDLNGGTWQYSYDISHRLTEVIDPTGATSERTEYDSAGRAVRQYDGLDNKVVELVYNSDGTTTVTDAAGKEEIHTYDNRGTIVGQTNAAGDNTSKTYDYNFRPKTLTDEIGLTTNLTWSEDGVNLLQVEDALGQLTTLNYDSNNNITSTVDSANYQTQYFYENTSFPTLLTRSIDALGAETTYVYDGDGNLTSTSDPLGHTTSYGYDAYGQRTSVTNALNQTTSYSYDSLGRLVDTTEPNGRVSHNIYNTAGYLLQSIQNYDSNKSQNEDSQYNITTTYTYDLMGRQTSVTDTYGHTTTYEYDANGQVVSTTDPDGNETTNTYNAMGQIVSSTDAMGRTTGYEYDELGRLVETTDPAGHTTGSEYNPDGTLAANIDAGGHRTTYGYDDLKRIIRTNDAGGYITHTTYDNAGNVASSTDAEGNTTTYTYDALGRQIKQTFEDDSFTETFYDDAGNRIQSIDAMGNATTYAYDELNRLTSSTDELGNSTSYTYNTAGQQATVTDPLGNVTGYQYDTLGRQVVVTFPGGATNTSTYDALGNVIYSTDAKGQTTTNTYDILNRLVSTSDPAGGVTSYTYDDAGNRLSMTDANSKITTYRYNNLNQLVEETNALSKSITYTYDAVGNTTSVTDATGATTTYGYDNLGRQTSVTNALSVSVDYTYDGNGNRTQMKDGKNIRTRYEYNSQGQLISVTENYRSGETGDNDTNVKTEYTYDTNGNRTKIKDASGHETTFTYDELNQLVSESDAQANTTSYSYDAAGNQTSITDALGRTTSYTYNSRGLLTNINYPDPDADVSYSYDANGQRIGMQDGVGSTSWNLDSLGRATSITDPFNQTTTYNYDSVGNRIQMGYPGVEVNYQYDDLNRMTTVTDWRNQITSYYYDDDNRVEMILQPAGLVTLLERDDIGQIQQMQTTQNWKLINSYEYEYDHNGNRTSVKEHLDIPERVPPAIVVTVTDANGILLADQEVTAYEGVTDTGFSAQTDSNGVARFILPDGTYRFGTNLGNTTYYSGEANHCEVKVCSAVAFTLTVAKVTVFVKDSDEATLANIQVTAFTGNSDTGINGITDANGLVILGLPVGDYRFKMGQDGSEAFSGWANHCSVPSCSEVTISFLEPGEVTIRVIDFQGSLQPGIEVSAFEGEVNTGISGITNEEGEVTLLIQGGNYRFMAEKDEKQYFSADKNHCAIPTECSEVEIEIPTAGFVRVEIKDADGVPLQGIFIDALDGEEWLGYWAITDENGVAVFELSDGSYRFGIWNNGFQYYTSTENHCTVPDCYQVKYSLPVFSPVTVTVQDTSENPISDQEIYVYRGEERQEYSMWTDENGLATLILPEGQYRSTVYMYGQEYYSGDINHCTVPACSSMSITVPEPYTVEVTLEDYWGNPIADREVYALDGNEYTNVVGITNEQGIATLSITEGDYRFGSDYSGRAYYSGTENHCNVPTCTSIQLTFPELYPVTVTVEDENGTPWTSEGITTYNNEQKLGYSAYTNNSGEAILYLPPGDYRFNLKINIFDNFSGTQNHCTVPACTTATITTPIFYPVTITVKDTANNIQPNATIQLSSNSSWGTDSDGQAVIPMPPGDHRVSVYKYGNLYYSQYCSVPTCLSIDAIVPASETVLVTVLDSADNPVADQTVETLVGEDTNGVNAVTNSNGIATLSLADQGSYRFRTTITTSNHTYTYYSGVDNHCTIPGCSSSSIEVPQFGNVTVTVLDVNSLPVAGASVYVYTGTEQIGESLDTDANGLASFSLPEGSYRFKAIWNEEELFSGTENHCTITGCTAATIQYDEQVLLPTWPKFALAGHTGKGLFSPMKDETTPVTVSVVDSNGLAQADLTVHVYDGSSDTGISGITDGLGQVVFDLANGDYRVRVDKFTGQYFSGSSNHCSVPTCTAINATVPVYGVVSVAVADSGNTVQPGLSVVALDGTEQIGSGVLTGQDGTAVFNLPEGSYRFSTEFNSQTYSSGTDDHCSVPTCTSAGITVPIYASVTVSVTDTASVVQAGLQVTAYQGDTTTAYTAITDENGQASLTLPEGSYHFRTVKNGYTASSGSNNHCTVPACSTASITLPTFSEVVVTVADSASVAQADLPVFAYDGENQTGYNTLTDVNGQATLNLPEGSYRFRTTTHSLNYYSSAENGCTTPICTTALVTVPQFGEVTVTVSDSADTPQADLPVYAYTGDTYTGFFGTTGSNGQAVLTLPEGNYRFRTTTHSLDYYSSAENACSVITCTSAAISVPRFGEVTVTVKDSNNTVQANRYIEVYSGTTYSDYSGTTNASGQVTMTLPEGEYRFKTRYGYLEYFSAETNHCSVPTCTSTDFITPVLGTVAITMVDTAGTTYQGLGVTALRVIGEELQDAGIVGFTDEDGHVSLTMPEGSYRFITGKNGFDYTSDLVTVPTDTTYTFTIPIFHQVSVLVVDRDQEPQPDISVYVYDGENYTGASGGTDADGKFYAWIPEGKSYRFRADQYGLAYWSGAENHCATPTCNAVTITALGFDYTASDQTIEYTYDDLNRLTAADYDTGLYYHYTYDAVGNRTGQETAFVTDPLLPPTPTVTAYTFDNANRLATVNTLPYTFDANGNLLSDGEYTYSYDSANRLSAINKTDTAITYRYNGQGDRIQQTVNGVENNYTLDLNSGLTQVLAFGDETYLYGLDRLGYYANWSMYSYLPDALGSVRQVIRTDGQKVGLTLAKSYDPYGEVIYSNGAAASYGFAGEAQDSYIKLVNLRSRLYSTETGRFLTRDTWQGDYNTPLSLNKWNYVNGNPVNYFDPSGLCGENSGSGSERKTKDCNTLVNGLESAYGIVVYWPGRINLPEGVPNDIGCLCGSDKKLCFGEDVPDDGNPIYKKWKYEEITAFAVAVKMYESEMGFNATKAMMQNVVIGRNKGNKSHFSDISVGGEYFQQLPGFGKPGIILFDYGMWEWGDSIGIFAHEMGHRQIDWYENEIGHRPNLLHNAFRNQIWNGKYLNPKTGPSGYARTSVMEEDMAESIRIYLMGHHKQDWSTLMPIPSRWFDGNTYRFGDTSLTDNRNEYVSGLFTALQQMYP